MFKYGIVVMSNDDGKFVVVEGLVEKFELDVVFFMLSIIGRYILMLEIFWVFDCYEWGVGNEI